ncbi:ATP-binding protein [Acinetobacter sp.]|uniref:ATP-binding protein n=1 Tax=Acinetobacter sp. TaxID=472 RepID=UPI002648D20E|nr:ATP-binding protein [Acinetobacter sp.]MDN5511765.1 ATP-binding protein [Acinetobacter sp.]MDN5524881.1 ATP-binding protein [Acinetobacter sp.]
MALNIIPADQALNVSAIITYIYADPGLGKTSLGFTADKAISFDFDRGAHRTGELRRGAVVPVQQWSDIENIKEQDLAPFNTVVIDTVGAMLESIKTHLLKTANNRQQDGALKLKAQGLANMKFKQYINTLLSFGKDVVFIAHASEDQNGEQIVYRPELGGKNRNELYRIADIMGYLTTVRTSEGKNARVINFKPSPAHHAKNSGALGGETGEVWLPDLKTHPTFLADLIKQAKDHINTLTPDQLASAKAISDMENWKQSCNEIEHAGDLNQLTESLQDLVQSKHVYAESMRQSLLLRAKELGCKFNKQSGKWENPVEFQAISDAQRDQLQAFIDERGLDIKTVCEHLGIDSLLQIDIAQLQSVQQEIDNLAKQGITA